MTQMEQMSLCKKNSENDKLWKRQEFKIIKLEKKLEIWDRAQREAARRRKSNVERELDRQFIFHNHKYILTKQLQKGGQNGTFSSMRFSNTILVKHYLRPWPVVRIPKLQ